MISPLTGRVGIFWGIPSRASSWTIVTDHTELSDAEPYGDFLTHPRGHYDVWEAWQSLEATGLKARGLPLAILGTEYEEFPRGRIVYRRPTDDFVLYADRRLQRPELIAEVAGRFALRTGTFSVQSDAHYRT